MASTWGTSWGTSWGVSWDLEFAVVPDVAGLTQAQAVAALEAAGFVVSVTTARSSTIPAGSVIEQQPAAGSEAAPGSTVLITVSSGDSVATDPKLIAGPRRYKNVGFKANKRKRDEPPAPQPERPKAKASGLLKGLLARAVPPLPAIEPLPPALDVDSAALVPAVLDAMVQAAAGVTEPAPMPSAPVEKPEADALQALRQRVDVLTRMVVEITQELAELRQAHGPQPMPALRDPLDDALVALLPAARESLQLEEPDAELEESAGLPELDEDEQRELSGEAAPAAPAAAPAFDIEAENRRRAEILARRML